MADLALPPPGGAAWPDLAPEAAGFDPAALHDALGLAATRETPWPRDLQAHLEAGHFEPPPDNAILGPVAPRGGPCGLLLRHGHRVAEFGDRRRIDMTFSVAKSYLGLLAGLAWGDGLIGDLDEPVSRSVAHAAFAGPRNGAVTWRHLLQQTSEWEGELFGKPDQIDRGRELALEGRGRKGLPRPLRPPGGHWEYNDVRVNALSLALLLRFGRALPEVFAERILAPIGASADCRWEGYRTSWVELPGGGRAQSVSGGGHWGGGVFIHAEDQARIGLLVLNRGGWAGRQVVPERWIALSAEPCALNPSYGFLWWLNTDGARMPAAPRDSVFFSGAGGNLTWVDPAHGIVAVFRWVDPAAQNEVVGRILGALRQG